jgi:hypothetical protein
MSPGRVRHDRDRRPPQHRRAQDEAGDAQLELGLERRSVADRSVLPVRTCIADKPKEPAGG